MMPSVLINAGFSKSESIILFVMFNALDDRSELTELIVGFYLRESIFIDIIVSRII